MSGRIWAAHSRSTISSWVSTEYAEPPPLKPSITSKNASMRIENVRQLVAIEFLMAWPDSASDSRCVRSSRTGSPALGYEVRLAQHPRRLRFTDVDVGESLQQPKDIQQPKHHGFDYDCVED